MRNRTEPHALLVTAVKAALSQLRGTYGLVMMFRDYPDVIIAARLGSPLVVGVGDDEHFIASDASPLAGYTDKIVYLSDHQIAVVTADSVQVMHRDQGEVRHSVESLQIEAADADLGGFAHYMLKEIFEQPESLEERHARPVDRRRRHGDVRRLESDAPATAAVSSGSF